MNSSLMLKLVFLFFISSCCFFSEANLQEKPATNDPRLVTTGNRIRAEEHARSVVLPCEIYDLGEFVVIWKKAQQVLFANTLKVFRDERISLARDNNHYNLVISNVTLEDAGDYTCSLSTNPPKEITHVLHVPTLPSLTLVPESGLIVVIAGNPILLECHSGTQKQVIINWRRINSTIANSIDYPPSNLIINQTLLRIEHARPQDAGLYECEGKNSVGNSSAIFRVTVHYPPQIRVRERTVHGHVDETQSSNQASIDLSCDVKAEPTATTLWTKDGRQIFPTQKYIFRRINGTSLVMTINGVTLEDFGNYTCVANNTLGSNSVSIEVSSRPSSPRIISNPFGNKQDEFTLEWSSASTVPLKPFIVRIRQANEPTHTTDDRTPSHASDWLRSIQVPASQTKFVFDDLEPNTRYEVEILAENEHGVSTSEIFAFSTSSSGILRVSFLVLIVSSLSSLVWTKSLY